MRSLRNIIMALWLVLNVVYFNIVIGSPCTPSVTTASGSLAPATICSGALIFSEEFEHFDLHHWEHKLGNVDKEFQYYVNDSVNSFAQDGILYIRPTVAPELLFPYNEEDAVGNDITVYVQDSVKSARIHSLQSFRFRYGRVEVGAKMPAGDWLFPAIWMMPSGNLFGKWPQSGEIDIVESRGNRDLYLNGKNIGTHEVATTLHFGPDRQHDAYKLTTWAKTNDSGFETAFHRYQVEWTTDYLKFSIDDVETGRVAPPDGGFYELGNFSSQGIDNLWKNGTKMAPFDQEFYFILNVAVGTTSGYFPDNATNPVHKPWSNASPTAASDFWDGRAGWLPTWNLHTNEGKDAALQVDYVKVWAL